MGDGVCLTGSEQATIESGSIVVTSAASRVYRLVQAGLPCYCKAVDMKDTALLLDSKIALFCCTKISLERRHRTPAASPRLPVSAIESRF